MKSMKEGTIKMKSMKKLVTLLFSLVMLCAFAIPVMADEPTSTYSITINGAVAGHTYTAYQVFEGVYSSVNNEEYLSDVEWGNGVDGSAILAELGTNETLKDRFAKADSAEKVAYVLQTMKDKSAELDEFARVVGKHLTTTTAGTTNKVAVETTNVKIDNLAAGYYFVKDSDSSAIGTGEIATKFLVEVVGNATVDIKADAPTIKKEIVKKDDSTVNGTSANVGDEITFKLTANVPDMANFDTYTFTISDTLSKGLTFDATTVAVNIGSTKLKPGTNYTLTAPSAPETDNTFKIDFTKEQLGDNVKHAKGAEIVVTYKATLNSNALTVDRETNTAKLTYSNNPDGSGTGTTPDTHVYVYDFDLTVDKYDGTDKTTIDKKLKDAVFVLYKLDETNNKKYYKQNAGSKVEWVENKATATPQTTDENGKATFKGLEEGTYYLEEIKAPKGYNTLKDPVAVEIKATYKPDGTLDTTATDCKLKQDAANSHYFQVQSIANKAGAVLPSTGGIGTTIFYVLGSIMALGAAVLLIAKKRVNGQDR